MKKISIFQILIILIVAFVLIVISTYLGNIDIRDIELPWYMDSLGYDKDIIFLSLFATILFIFPIIISIKFLNITFSLFIWIMEAIFIFTIYEVNYWIITDRLGGGTFTHKWANVLSNSLGIILSSIIFFIFLKWYLKPNNENEV